MKKYIATRVIKSVYGGYIVQAQSNRTYNWENLTHYPEGQKAVSEVDACNKAQEFSKNVEDLVIAYNCGGYELKGFINGNQYIRDRRFSS